MDGLLLIDKIQISSSKRMYYVDSAEGNVSASKKSSTTGVLKDDASLKAFKDVIEDFEKISGLKINTSKSECMGIGEARGRKGDFFGLKWPERPIKDVRAKMFCPIDFFQTLAMVS